MKARFVSDERGTTLLMVAASLLVLMGFAALAVDWGFGVNQRRADQNSSDFGALAAVQKAQTQITATCNQASVTARAACNGAEAAMDIVNQNLTFTPDWSQANCDPGKPAEYNVPAPNTDCVWYTSSLDRARVATPTIEVDTYFARVFGVDTVDTAAQAEAGGRSLLGGAVLPFGIPAGLSGSTYDCIRRGPVPDWGPCDDVATGNFGSLDIPVYGTEEFVEYGGAYVETTTQCTGQTNTRMAWNIAAGVDHPFTEYSGGVPINDRDSCPVFNAGPNELAAQTGIGSALEPGLYSATSAYSASGSPVPGRLARGGNQVQIKNGVFSDNTPLWNYLAPGACPGTSDHAGMEACLSGWGSGVIFSASIANAPRFGFAPQLDTDFGPPSNYTIDFFRPVYLDTAWFQCNASGACQTVHSPGEIDPSISAATDSCSGIVEPVLSCGFQDTNQDIQALSSYLLHPLMLPESIREPRPGSAAQLAYNLYR